MRKKNAKPPSAGKHCPRPRFTNKTPWELGRSRTPPPTFWVHRLSRPKVQTPGCISFHWWVLGSLSPGGGAASGGVGGFSLLEPPEPSTPSEETQIPVLGGGGGWLPKPWRDAQVHKTRTGLPTQRAGGWGPWVGPVKGRYSNTKATVEHNTMGKGGGEGGNKTQSQVVAALGSPDPPGVRGWFWAAGQVSV